MTAADLHARCLAAVAARRQDPTRWDSAGWHTSTIDLLDHILTEHDYRTNAEPYCLGCRQQQPWPCDLYRAAAKALGVDASHAVENRAMVDDGLPGNE